MPTEKIQTKWNLKLLYKSHKDPQIEKDIKATEREFKRFASKYQKSKEWLKKPRALKTALEDYEKLGTTIPSSKIMRYFAYAKDLDADDTYAEAMINKLSDRLTKIRNQILFFDLELGEIPKKKQKEFLKSKELSHYRYFLKQVFENAQYDLSEPEEKIMSLKSLPSYGLWVDGVSNVVNRETVVFKGKEIPLSEAQNKVSELPTKTRRKLQADILGKLKQHADFAQSEINAIVINKKINDELRGYKKPYSATVIGYENDITVVENFVELITKNFKLAHRFYKLKARLLKEKKLTYADRGAKIGTLTKKFPFKEQVSILRETFGDVDRTYLKVLDDMLSNGQIDVYPKKGKTGGAYMSSSVNMPSFVLLNNVDNFNSLTTFAHEMGHAIHSARSKSQSPIYEGYSTAVAETASTLFEQFVFDRVFETLSDKEKVIALHDKIDSSISTIFRQIALFNFEVELHEYVREHGHISRTDIAKLMNKHMKSYLGPAFDLKELDGYFFIFWGHIRYFFYVYSYAYGELISHALYEKYKEDPSYIKKIDQFLSAGGSKSPKDIFKEIGIDTTSMDFFKLGLKNIEKEIKELEKLTK